MAATPSNAHSFNASQRITSIRAVIGSLRRMLAKGRMDGLKACPGGERPEHDAPLGSADVDGRATQDPWRLIYPPGGIGLVWSPKAACTTAILWYLAHIGHLRAAIAFNSWPHEYRMRVLPVLDEYRRWSKQCNRLQLKWVRVIRCPFLRAVSSYRHALRHGFENQGMTHFLGLPVAERGFSFVEFLGYLRVIDIESCDPHLKQQFHLFESGMPAAHVINADREPLLKALYDFADPGEEARPLLEAEIARLADTHHARRVVVQHDCSRVVFSASSTIGEWPDYEAFLNRQTRGDVEVIYRTDLERFGPFL